MTSLRLCESFPGDGALRRLYVGLQVMTLMAVGVVGLAALVALEAHAGHDAASLLARMKPVINGTSARICATCSANTPS